MVAPFGEGRHAEAGLRRASGRRGDGPRVTSRIRGYNARALARPIQNPWSPFQAHQIDYEGEAPPAELMVSEEEARSMLSENDSPDLDFRYSVNPYRGCLHACAYCYARPTHEFLGLGAGTDFDRRLVVKTNAPTLLRRELSALERWETVTFSGNTDCYQGLEGSYRLTRACLEVCADLGFPVHVITKNALVARDVDVLSALAARGLAEVFLSIPFDDDDDARKIEPYASSPTRRFEALATLSAAGIPTGVSFAPLIPGLNDDAVARVLARAKEAGAARASITMLRLPGPVEPIFFERLREAFPLRAARIERAIRDVRDGGLSRSEFGARMRGAGPRWDATKMLFDRTAAKLGLVTTGVGLTRTIAAIEGTPRRGQLKLFGD